MRTHFVILVVGSILFLVRFVTQTWEQIVWSSDPSAGAARNTAHILNGLQSLGIYIVFAALVIAHGILPRKSKAREQSEESLAQ